jgi:phosphate-selective porin
LAASAAAVISANEVPDVAISDEELAFLYAGQIEITFSGFHAPKKILGMAPNLFVVNLCLY